MPLCAEKKKRNTTFRLCFLVEEGGFEPPKSVTTDLQSAPFGRSGTPPYLIGAGGRIRTPDLLITNQLLYQLSYTSKCMTNSRIYLSRCFAFCQHLFYFFILGGTLLLQPHLRNRSNTVLCCTLCGQEITPGKEYWACNGHFICPDCLNTFARREFAPFQEIRGKELLP